MHLLPALSERVLEGVARWRHARALHPRGTSSTGTWVVDDPESALGRFGTGGRAAVVRLSRGLGLPAPLPDVHGVAVRLEADTGRVDLLFSGTRRFLSTLLPYRSGSGLALLELRRTGASAFDVRERSVTGPARAVDLRPVRFLSRVREAAYAGSRRGRCR
jgi:hypothetical protein